MGAYVDKADVENTFGVDNVAAWSDLTGAGSADATRIALAITYAEGLINDSFRDGRYAIPFSPIPVVLKDWCAKLAGVWLFFNRPLYGKNQEAASGFIDVRTMVLDEVNSYTSGRRKFSATLSTVLGVNAPVVA